MDRYKARLVVLGNNQAYGVNYEETFALVAKMTIVHTILTLVASNDWPLHRMDVKNEFLHRDLKECIYMKPPPGLFSSRTSNVYNFVVLFMVSNKLHEPGLISFEPLYYNFPLSKANMTLHCFFENPTWVLLSFWFMLIVERKGIH